MILCVSPYLKATRAEFHGISSLMEWRVLTILYYTKTVVDKCGKNAIMKMHTCNVNNKIPLAI